MSIIPYMRKHSRGKTSTVCQQYSLCSDFCSLPMTAYFSVLITKQEISSGKTFMVSKNPQNL